MKLMKKVIGALLLLGSVAVLVGRLYADTPIWPPPVPLPPLPPPPVEGIPP